MMKKALWALFLILIGAGISLAQNSSANSAPPDVVILKFKWKGRATFTSFEQPSHRSIKNDDLRDATRLPDPNRPPPPRYAPLGPYFYSMKIKNIGAKTITGVIWEYIFVDPKNHKELGRHRFHSPDRPNYYLKIRRNQSATLNANLSLPPTHVVSAQEIGKGKQAPYLERAEIKCVKYADGSWWKHPAARASDCEELESKSDEKGK